MSFFGVFFRVLFGAQRVPKGSPKGSKIDEKEVSKRYLKKGPKKEAKMKIFKSPQCGSIIVNNSKINDFRVLFLAPFGSHFGVVLAAQMEAKSMKKWFQKVIQKHV